MDRQPSEPTWREGDFYDNLAAAADAVGFNNAGIAFGLAHVEWASVADREAFLTAITQVPFGEVAQGA